MARCKTYDRIQHRRDTAANWLAKNPPLLEGEIGLETDTWKCKIGNGRDRWGALPYWPDVAVGGFSETSPLAYTSPEVTAQSSGQPIGLSADGLLFHQPLIVAAIPVTVNGKEYLIPLVEK